MDNKNEIYSRWEEVENKIFNLMYDVDNDIDKVDFLRERGEYDDKTAKELSHDLECEMMLFKHLLETIKFWKSTICVTEEKTV